MSYREYLESDEWRRKRAEAIDRAGGRCVICAYSGRNLDVHHRSYENIGNEGPEDLVVLCRLCHTRHHKAIRPLPRPSDDSANMEALRRITRIMRARSKGDAA